jgi:hypothetical protein
MRKELTKTDLIGFLSKMDGNNEILDPVFKNIITLKKFLPCSKFCSTESLRYIYEGLIAQTKN